MTLSAPSLEPSSQQVCGIGIGTSTTAILKTTLIGFSGELNGPCFVQVDVVASGQTINCYAYAGSSGNVTIGCGAAAGPAELSAVLVAS